MSKQFLAVQVIDNAHPSDVFALSTTESYVLSGGGDGVKVWAAEELVHVFHAPLGVHHLAVDASGVWACASLFDCKVKLYNMTHLEEIGGFGENTSMAGEAWALAISPDAKTMAATTYDGRVNLFSMSTRQKTGEYQTKGSFGMSIDWSADGKYICSGHENGNLYVYHVESGKLMHSLPGHTKAVRAVRFSPGSTMLAAAGDGKVLTLYDLASGQQVSELCGHTAGIYSIDWSRSGEFLVTGCADGKVKVWSLERKEALYTQNESESGIWAIQWRSNGFVTGGADASLRIYREAGHGC